MKRALEFLIYFVLISAIFVGAFALSDVLREEHRIRNEEIRRLQYQIDSLRQQSFVDSVRAAEFIKRVDSLMFGNDTIIFLKR